LVAVGAILIAILLHLISEPITRWCRLPRGLALTMSGTIMIGVFGIAGYLFGTRVGVELQDVLSRAENATRAISSTLKTSDLGGLVLSHFAGDNFSITSIASRLFSLSSSFAEAAVVIVITGFYFAAEPSVYRVGLVRLFPAQLQPEVNETIADIAVALRLWLIGQLVQMLLIGSLCTLAVSLIGLQSPLALGLIAGLAEFIPFLGPIIASIPALLVATTNGSDAVLWTALAYLLIHQVESDVITPLLQRRMVYIPPGLMLLGIVAISAAFGTVALVFAAPAVVIILVTVQKIYVRDALGEHISLPGEKR
jgi:predicted PurR-regulated permease PerM